MKAIDAIRRMARLPEPPATAPSLPPEIGTTARSPWEIDLDMANGEPGYLSIDANPELSGQNRYTVFDEMRMSDSMVRSVAWMVKLPIRRADWNVTPVSEDPVDLAVADSVRWLLGFGDRYPRPALRHGFDKLLAQQLLCIDYGSMDGELVWGRDLEPFVDNDGDVHMLHPIVKVGARYPRATARFVQADPADRAYIGGLYQHQASEKLIPGHSLFHSVLEPETDPYRGVSLLRPCVGPWTLKKNMLVSSAIGHDRYSAGIPIVRYPQGGTSQQRARAIAIARDLRHHERAFVVFEGLAEDGWDVDILSGNGSLADPIPLLQHYDQMILGAGLAKFAELGITATGSRATAQVLQDPFYQSLESLAGMIRDDLQLQIVDRFVEMNFTAAVKAPRVTVQRISDDDMAAIGNYITSLRAAGVPLNDIETVQRLRRIGGLPEAPDAPPGTVVTPEGESVLITDLLPPAR